MALSLREQWKSLTAIAAVFVAFYFLPLGSDRFGGAVIEALRLAQWYAREHVLLCLVPAFFIAGAIAVFVSQSAVIRYLGPQANRAAAYGVASVSGSVLAVCSCTVLPLFAGIYRMGAGLGPASTFLYAGPAINVLAIILTGRILGLELGVARAVGAVVFSILLGLLMHLFFRRDEADRAAAAMNLPPEQQGRPLWQNATLLALLVMILVFATWGRPDQATGFWQSLYQVKWLLTALAAGGLGITLIYWLRLRWWKLAAAAVLTVLVGLIVHNPIATFTAGVVAVAVSMGTEGGEPSEWLSQTWDFARQIMPLLFYGVLIAGLLLGRPAHEGLIPSSWVESAVGGNSLAATLLASVAGAFMYFATLTEIPILQGLMGAGMGDGPALALLLAGPAVSLPNLLVIRSVLGTKKTVVFLMLVIVMATAAGYAYGQWI